MAATKVLIMNKETIVFDSTTGLYHYQVADTVYNGRPARVLFSGNRRAAISGLAQDGKAELLFDYNERFMELIRGLKPKRVLLLGGGAFTLPRAINEEFPDISLDVVELDPELYNLARRYFDFHPNKRTHIYIGDGIQYLTRLKRPYDLIIVDVFTDAAIPLSFQTKSLAHSLKRGLRDVGVVAMNIIASYHGRRSMILRRQIAVFDTAFKDLQLYPADSEPSLWLPQNFVLTAQNGSRELGPHLRFAGLILPVAT